MSYIIGVDTGGTFTDVIVIDEVGRLASGKSPTTPTRLVEGVLAAVEDAAQSLGASARDVLSTTTVFRFSGTTAINTLLTRSGVSTGLITTRGFEDTLAIGRAISAWAALSMDQVRRAYKQRKPSPLVSRNHIYGVHERIDRDGEVVVPLHPEEIREAAGALVGDGVQSIAICFLWSTRNAEHERAACAVVREMFPDVYVCASHEVASNLGEYERFNTAVVNAYVAPRLTAFLGELGTILRENGFGGELLIGQSDGGVLYADESPPVYMMQSGPAAGVIASRNEGEVLGLPNVITTDVGGTSFDVGMVADGKWVVSRSPLVDRFHVGFQMIDVESVGAGGGSIAWIDAGGGLNVGPQSAGASPGPACYGRGGREPTVTDAAAVLGYFDPAYFLAGKSELRLDLASQAIEPLAEQLEMDVARAAAGIFAIANAKMSALVSGRVVSRGFDPRDFILFAYGGAGAMHAAFYAADLGIREVIVPGMAGTFSALGVATAPLLHSARLLDFAAMPLPAEKLNANFQELEAKVSRLLDRDQIPEEDRSIVYSLDMRYGVQVNTVTLYVERKLYDDDGVEELGLLFDALYERIYGRGSGFTEAGRFVTAVGVEGYGYLPAPARAQEVGGAPDPSAAHVGVRDAYFEGRLMPTDIYRLDRLARGNTFEGPAIVGAAHTTIVVPAGYRATLDPYRNVRILIPQSAATAVPEEERELLRSST